MNKLHSLLKKKTYIDVIYKKIYGYFPLIIFILIIPACCILNIKTLQRESIKEYMIITGIMLTCIFYLVLLLLNEKDKVIYGNTLLYSYLFFLFCVFLPNLFFTGTYEATHYMLQYVSFLLTIILTINLFRNYNHVKIFLSGILLILTIIVLSCSFEYFGIDLIGLATITNYKFYGQSVTFTFGNPNFLGGFLLITLQLLLVMIFLLKHKLIKIYVSLVFLINTILLFLTKSRGAGAFFIIGFIMQIFLLGYLYYAHGRTNYKINPGSIRIFIYLSITGIIFVIILLSILMDFIKLFYSISIFGPLCLAVIFMIFGFYFGRNIFKNIKNSIKKKEVLIFSIVLTAGLAIIFFLILNICKYDLYIDIIDTLINPISAVQERIPAYKAAVSNWLKSPVIGNGLGSFHYLAFQSIPSDYKIFVSSRNYMHVHNEYLELLSDGGILSLIAFVLIIFIVFKQLINVLKNPEFHINQRYLSACFLSILISFLLYNIFSVNMRFFVNAYLFYIIITLSFIIPLFHKKDENNEKRLVKKRNIIGVTQNNTTGLIYVIIISIISIGCWYGIRLYYKSDKGIYEVLKLQNKVATIQNINDRRFLLNYEKQIKDYFNLYNEFKSNQMFTDRINNEYLINQLKMMINTSDLPAEKYMFYANKFLESNYFFEGLLLTEYAYNKYAVSWQPGNIIPHYQNALNYYTWIDYYRYQIKEKLLPRDVLLKGLNESLKVLDKYLKKTGTVIPDYNDIVLRKANCYLYQGIINSELKSVKQSKEKIDNALRDFISYKEQDIYDLNARISLLFLYTYNNQHNKFINEIKEIINDEMNRKFYFTEKKYKVNFMPDNNAVDVNIQDNCFNYYFGNKYVNSIYSGIDTRNLTIEKIDNETVKLAKKIGDMFREIKGENDLWKEYYDYVYKYGQPDLKQKVSKEFIDFYVTELNRSYKKNEWFNMYNTVKKLYVYGWESIIDYEKYDTVKNRRDFILYLDLQKGVIIDINDWDRNIIIPNFKKDYENYLYKLFFYDLLLKNKMYKELSVFKSTLKMKGIVF